MENSIKIVLLCCNYTNLIEGEDVREILGRLEIWRFPCSGQIEITDMLRAFRMGADGVLVADAQEGLVIMGGEARGQRGGFWEQGRSSRRLEFQWIVLSLSM